MGRVEQIVQIVLAFHVGHWVLPRRRDRKLRAGDLMEGDENHGLVPGILSAMPYVSRDEGHVSRLHHYLFLVDDLFPFPFQIELNRVAMGVKSAIGLLAGDGTFEHPKCMYVET